MDAEAVEQEGGLHRSLGSGQLSMIAIGGAIGTGLFLGSGFAISLAGPAVLVSYAIGGVITLLLMGCLAEMTVTHPSTGSFGLFAEVYVGRLAGFLVRVAYVSANILAVGTEVTAVAVYMKFWLPEVPGWWWILGFSAALVGINMGSVRIFGAVEYMLSLIKVVAIVAFLLLGSYVLFNADPRSGMGLANYTAEGGFMPHGVSGIWIAVIVAIFSYLSVEMIAVAAGEAREPERAIVKAFRATIFRLLFFYLCTLALMLAILPWPAAGTATSPFVTVMAATGIPGAAGVINLVILVAALSAMNSQLYASTRMIFSLARSGYVPAWLGRVGERGVPRAALAVSSFGIAVGAIIYILRPDDAFTAMIAISIFGALFTWMMIFVTHLRFRALRGAPTSGFRMWGSPWTSLSGAVLMAAILVTTLFTSEFRLTLLCGIPYLALLTGLYAWRFRRAGVAPSSVAAKRRGEGNDSGWRGIIGGE